MTKREKRRARADKISAAVAAGTYRAPHRSHFQTEHIRDVVQADLAEKRAQMRAQRDRTRDREWAFRAQPPTPPALLQ